MPAVGEKTLFRADSAQFSRPTTLCLHRHPRPPMGPAVVAQDALLLPPWDLPISCPRHRPSAAEMVSPVAAPGIVALEWADSMRQDRCLRRQHRPPEATEAAKVSWC